MIQKNDKLNEHIKSCHFKDPLRSSFRRHGYLLIQRHEQYLKNNHICESPKVLKCSVGTTHASHDINIE